MIEQRAKVVARRAGIALIAAVNVALVAGLAVLAWRWFATGPDPYTMSPFRPDPVLSFRYRPNLDMTVRTGNPARRWRLRTDGHGARVGEAPIRYGAPAVVAVGGSQAAGHGVAAEETFVARIAKAVGCQAYNLAVPSHGGVQALYQLQALTQVKPALVVYGFWPSHPERNICRCARIAAPVCLEQPHLTVSDGGFAMRAPRNVAPAFGLIRRWERGDRAAGTWAAMRAERDAVWERCRSEQSRRTHVDGAVFVLRRLAALAAKKGARLVVVDIADYHRDYVPGPQRLARAAEALGVDFVATADELRAGRERGIPGDGHLTSNGHALIAEAVLKRLGDGVRCR